MAIICKINDSSTLSRYLFPNLCNEALVATPVPEDQGDQSKRFCGHQFTKSGVNDGKIFRNLAAELEKCEPSLREVTGNALFSTYDRFCDVCHEYQAFLDVETGDLSIKTILMEYAEKLYNIDADLLILKQKRSELKENKKKRLERVRDSRNNETLRIMMEPLERSTARRNPTASAPSSLT
ncbi:hypothetical protein BGX27_005328 [Mortierella sp. AM989]|nr:hypothetical protein BGX27_005328 [Mortierella sp. AM989]